MVDLSRSGNVVAALHQLLFAGTEAPTKLDDLISASDGFVLLPDNVVSSIEACVTDFDAHTGSQAPVATFDALTGLQAPVTKFDYHAELRAPVTKPVDCASDRDAMIVESDVSVA